MTDRASAEPARSTGTRVLLAVVGLLLVVVAGRVATSTVYVGDNHCGRVAWDTHRQPPCTREIDRRTIVAAVGVVIGAALLLTAARWSLPAVLVVAGLGLAAFGVGRALDPVDAGYCGSVLNRHRVAHPSTDDSCDDALRPRRDLAIGAVAAGGAVIAAAAVLEGRRRRPPGARR